MRRSETADAVKFARPRFPVTAKKLLTDYMAERERLLPILSRRVFSVTTRKLATRLISHESDSFSTEITKNVHVTSPASFYYHAIHGSFKMYYVKSLLAARCVLIAAQSPRIDAKERARLLKELRNLQGQLVVDVMQAGGVSDFFMEIVGPALLVKLYYACNDKWTEESAKLMAAEGFTRGVLGAFVAGQPFKKGCLLSEAQALVMSIYRVR